MLGKLLMELRAELTAHGPYDELAHPLNPPWLQHPNIPRYSIGWRMGGGEAYMCEWGPWYGGLSAGGKQKYQSLYPEPEEWQGFYTVNEE